MSELEESAKMLSDFGLTAYEAKVYLAVVKLGTTSAGRISKLTGIRREEVYRTLPKLEKGGLVDRVLGRPVKVKALPLEDALSKLIARKKEESDKHILELTAKKDDVLSTFRGTGEEIDRDEGSSNFVLISEKDAMTKRTVSLIAGAKRAIDIVDSSENVARLLSAYADDFRRLKSKNVRVRILTDCPDDEGMIPRTLDKCVPGHSFTLKYGEGFPSRYVVFDGREAMIVTSAEGAATEGKCLWTSDGSLLGLIERDFEDHFRTSTDWRTFRLSPSEKTTRILKRLRPRDHVILVYDSQVAKRNTLFNYIRTGLENGEAAKYICSEETPDEIKRGMEQFGVEVREYEKSGALDVLSYDGFYITNGEFSMPEVMSSWDRLYREAMTDGFRGMRATGEMSCFIQHHMIPELIQYEQALHTFLDIPMTAICAYSADMLARIDNPIDVYSELVKAHGKVLFAGKDSIMGRIEIRKA